MEIYDLIVIGSGPAGRRAAIQASKFGESVLVVEKSPRVGGVSVHTDAAGNRTEPVGMARARFLRSVVPCQTRPERRRLARTLGYDADPRGGCSRASIRT